MLSYQWDHQRQVKRAFDLLTQLGLKVWMDTQGGMSTDVYDSMAEGVSNASVVVCFMSTKYQALSWDEWEVLQQRTRDANAAYDARNRTPLRTVVRQQRSAPSAAPPNSDLSLVSVEESGAAIIAAASAARRAAPAAGGAQNNTGAARANADQGQGAAGAAGQRRGPAPRLE